MPASGTASKGGRAVALDVRDLRLVSAVAAHGTLTRAASVLYLTQSALSHQLADLERRMGTRLFDRGARRMVLTPAGEELLERSGPILAAVDETEREVRGVARSREAVLRFSTGCNTGYHWLPRVLAEYQRSYPRVELRIVAGATRRPLQALLKGRIDLAIVSRRVR